MEQTTFQSELIQHLEFPFEAEDVKSVESNCGSVWIELKDGATYFISIDRCEN